MAELLFGFPRNETGRDQLRALIAKHRADGNQLELGRCLSQMAVFYKHIGPPDGSPAFLAAAKVGAEAVAFLREVGDKGELAAALVRAAVPFCRPDVKSILNEALALAQEIGDKELEGDVIFRMTGADGVEGHTAEEALACYEEAGSLRGQALCWTRIGFRPGNYNIPLLQKALAVYQDLEEEHHIKVLEMTIRAAKPWEFPEIPLPAPAIGPKEFGMTLTITSPVMSLGSRRKTWEFDSAFSVQEFIKRLTSLPEECFPIVSITRRNGDQLRLCLRSATDLSDTDNWTDEDWEKTWDYAVVQFLSSETDSKMLTAVGDQPVPGKLLWLFDETEQTIDGKAGAFRETANEIVSEFLASEGLPRRLSWTDEFEFRKEME